VALIVALFAWAPWNDDDVGGGPGTDTEENIDIEGDIDVNDGGNQEPQPQQSP
jgi:hypothetical protein